jgi:hypothetical protein
MQDCQEIKSTFQDIYDKVVFHGVYVKYGYCVKRLIDMLHIEDPAELHYVMMHLGRLSCINNRYGRYVWTSDRYRELHGIQGAELIESKTEASLFNAEVESELEKMRLVAFNASEISSSFIHAVLHSEIEFASHVKVYPLYNPQGHVVATLTILTEIMSSQAVLKSASLSKAKIASAEVSSMQSEADENRMLTF